MFFQFTKKTLPFREGFFCFLFAVTLGCTRSPSQLSESVIVQVGQHKLLLKDLATELSEKLSDFNSLTAQDSQVIRQTKDRIVHDFVVKSLTKDWAQKNDVFVRKEDLDKEIESIKSQYPDEISFRQALSLTGTTYGTWMEKQRDRLLEKLVLEKLRSKLTKPTQQEIKEYYESNKDEFKRPAQVRISQVVLDNEDHARKIYRQLRKGRKIADMAKKFSIAPEAKNGGDIGWVTRGTHEMFDTAFRLGVGGRSRVIKSPFGYHIFQVTGRRSAKTLRLKDVSDRIEKRLIAAKEQQVYSQWLESELLSAKVYKNEELIDEVKVVSRGKE